jgi:glycosyltransferase involved in cell wall biosynthesis
MKLTGLKIALVGPLPPPEGGMANQTRQLGELLQRDGAKVTILQVNAPYRPRWIGRVRGVRALFRLVAYACGLWRVAGNVDVFHIMANSGWSWHLFASPAVWIASMRGRPSVVNYRGGGAETFLAHSGGVVLETLHRASALAVPSSFLQQVFGRWGIRSEVVPNIVDTECFRPSHAQRSAAIQHVVVARNLEAIYDIATALRAFAILRDAAPDARLTVAGSGPERRSLETLASELGLANAVHFCGRLERGQMAELYRSASVVINPSRVDNMPNSVLEAMASGVPVVSTSVGGVPFILRDGVTGLLVPAGDHAAMAAAVQLVLTDHPLAARLRDAALIEVQQYTWPRVRQKWVDVYAMVLSSARVEARPA